MGVGGRHGPSVHFEDTTRDGEPEAGAVRVVRVRAAVEGHEQSRHDLVRHSRPAVADTITTEGPAGGCGTIAAKSRRSYRPPCDAPRCARRSRSRRESSRLRRNQAISLTRDRDHASARTRSRSRRPSRLHRPAPQCEHPPAFETDAAIHPRHRQQLANQRVQPFGFELDAVEMLPHPRRAVAAGETEGDVQPRQRRAKRVRTSDSS